MAFERSDATSGVPIATDCLSGGGTMGAMMRAFDWSTTPVGTVDRWPQSLRTAVSMLLESGFPMYIAWGPGLTQFYNDGYRPILGSTKHPGALGRSTRETFAEIWNIIGPMFERVMQGTAVNVEDFLLPLDRHGFVEECYFIYSYSPIRDESGRVGGVLVTVTETTARVLGERRLRTLRELSTRTANSTTVEATYGLATAVLADNQADLPFAITYAIEQDGSARQAAAFGLASATPARIDAGDPDPWSILEVARTGTAIELAVPPDTQLVNTEHARPGRMLVLPIAQPGETRPAGVIVVGLSSRLIFDGHYRNFLELVAGQIATAIASARALEEAKARAEALAELDRAKTAFFSNVSHEFRTPLTLLLGPLEDALASSTGSLGGEELHSVHRNALRLLKLVNSLLDFSRIEAGRVKASFEQVDLAALTTDLASHFRAALERGGLRLEVACDPITDAFVDRDMWEKIVLNLISNAFKFTFEGTIAVTLRRDGDRIVLAVRDTGVGVPAHELPRLFDRFHRVAGTRARTHEGSGIGLALVAELVKMHGGAIRAESTLGVGTTMTVEFPAGHAHLPADRVHAPTTLAPTALGSTPFVEEALRWLPDARAVLGDDRLSEPGPTTPPTHARIVVADDNADMRDYVRRLLASRWDVEAVGDGEAALAAARRALPDLVLSDVMMPGLDGFALLQALQTDPRTATVPVILLSARAGEEARIEALQAGAHDYLVKPFSARELVARVESQLALARAHRAVADLRDRLYELFMQAPAPICVIRGYDELVFEVANPRYEAVCGRTGMAGKPMFDALPELRGQGFDELLRKVMRTGEPHLDEEALVRLDRSGTGAMEDTFFRFVYSPLRDATGNIDRVMVFCIDITDQVRARRAAEAANRVKDEFLAMLGHELRNPLAPIASALELMDMRAGDVALREREIIRRHLTHVVRLVDDLLDVARITRGNVQLESVDLELAEIVAQAAEATDPLVKQRRHALVVDVPATGLGVHGDRTRLCQVVANLITNAAKYTEPGGRIQITGRRDARDVVLRVRDNGVGLTPEVLPRVFDLFTQEARSIDRSQGGLGIGLAIVRSLVTLHGGSVEAHSAGRNQGSEFVVRLPPLASAIEPGAPPTGGALAPASRRGLRVLVVDDNADAAQMIAESLRMMGHEVAVAPDGPRALELRPQFDPEVALLDIGLPGMNGFELARALRRDASDLYLVAVTGYGRDSDRERSRAAGFDAHLVKPLSLDTLRELLATDGLARARRRDAI